MTATFTDLAVTDLRFPTSAHLDGSDAMNPDPDYSAAYVILRTSAGDGLEGHGFTFTIGRGNEVVVAAVEALAPLVVGREVAGVLDDLGGFWRHVTGDSQLRWIGPEKGAIHLATAAIVNAVWDLRAKRDRNAAVAPAGRHAGGRARRLHPLPLHHRRAHPRRCGRDARGHASAPRRARAGASPGGPARLHHLGRLARLRRREAAARSAARPSPAAGRT